MIFEANVGDRITSYLNICNDGTTAIYFSWKVSTMIKIGQLQDWKMDESNGLFHGFFFLKFSYRPVREYQLTLVKRALINVNKLGKFKGDTLKSERRYCSAKQRNFLVGSLHESAPPAQLGIVTNFKAVFYAFLLTKLNTQWKGGPITIVLTL